MLLDGAGAAHGFPPEMELLAARLCVCCCGCDDPYAGGFGEAKEDIWLLLLEKKEEGDALPKPAEAGAACC